MQLQTARKKKEETPQEFSDRCLSLAMNTVPKLEDTFLQKFHYAQAQGMLLSTFIAGKSGNPGQQVRYQMSATVDQALQIAMTVFEAEAEEKRSLVYFRVMKPPDKVEVNLFSARRSLQDKSTERLFVLTQKRRM
jgi:hypothetical protein